MKRADQVSKPITPTKSTTESVLEKLIALRWMAHTHGFQTSRSQSTLLKTLNEAELTEVSLSLQQHYDEKGW